MSMPRHHIGHPHSEANMRARITLFDPWEKWDAMRLRQAESKAAAKLHRVRSDDQGDDPCQPSQSD